ncbi:hypothetical protein WJ972_10450 [Achromobacter insuavis]
MRAGFAAVVLALAAGPVAAQSVQLRLPSGAELAASCRNPSCRKAPRPRRP